jgi:hypothetical protein
MQRYNFGKFLGFFAKGLNHFKIQTKFKSWLLPKYIIQNPFRICICAQKESCSFLFILSPQKVWYFFKFENGSFAIFNLYQFENYLEKGKIRGAWQSATRRPPSLFRAGPGCQPPRPPMHAHASDRRSSPTPPSSPAPVLVPGRQARRECLPIP